MTIRKPTCTERTISLGSGLKVAVTIWKAEKATAIQNSARPSKLLPQPFSSRASVLVWPGIGAPGSSAAISTSVIRRFPSAVIRARIAVHAHLGRASRADANLERRTVGP